MKHPKTSERSGVFLLIHPPRGKPTRVPPAGLCPAPSVCPVCPKRILRTMPLSSKVYAGEQAGKGEGEVNDPVPPKAAIPLEELGEPVQPKTPVLWWRWALAILLAPLIFMMALLPIGILCGQMFNDIPDRWAFVPIIGELAFGL